MEVDDGRMNTLLADNLRSLAAIAISLPVGFVAGLVYFHALRRSADLMVSGGRATVTLALTAGRLALLVAILLAAAWFGALSLLAAAAGVIAGRNWIMRRNRTAGP
jgi:hypothetical protein